jgi:hypothetical protein
MIRVKRLLAAVVAVVPLAAQVSERPQTLRERQTESIRKQRESVRKQIGAGKEDSGWFTVPWPASEEWQIAPVQPIEPAEPVPEARKSSFAQPLCDPVPPVELDAVVGQAAQKHGLPADRLRDVIRKESAFYPCAVSPKGAMGLMQLMPGTARDMGLADAFDPAGNIDAGARFLRQLLDRYKGDWRLALGAYNAGPAAVDAAKGIPAYAETQDYVKDLLSQ